MASIRKTRVYDFPIEELWDALTDSERLGEWLMPNDFVAVVGHEFTFRTDPAPGFDGIVRAKVLKLDPPHEFEISWEGGGLDTVLNIRLEDLGGSTRLTLLHHGFRPLANFVPRFILGLGWGAMLKKRLLKELAREGSSGASKTDAE